MLGSGPGPPLAGTKLGGTGVARPVAVKADLGHEEGVREVGGEGGGGWRDSGSEPPSLGRAEGGLVGWGGKLVGRMGRALQVAPRSTVTGRCPGPSRGLASRRQRCQAPLTARRRRVTRNADAGSLLRPPAGTAPLDGRRPESATCGAPACQGSIRSSKRQTYSTAHSTRMSSEVDELLGDDRACYSALALSGPAVPGRGWPRAIAFARRRTAKMTTGRRQRGERGPGGRNR